MKAPVNCPLSNVIAASYNYFPFSCYSQMYSYGCSWCSGQQKLCYETMFLYWHEYYLPNDYNIHICDFLLNEYRNSILNTGIVFWMRLFVMKNTDWWSVGPTHFIFKRRKKMYWILIIKYNSNVLYITIFVRKYVLLLKTTMHVHRCYV